MKTQQQRRGYNVLVICLFFLSLCQGFVPTTTTTNVRRGQLVKSNDLLVQRQQQQQRYTRTDGRHSSSSSSSSLSVWWFGGTDASEEEEGDSCELVAVRIERTSPNSRRIAGEITVPAPLLHVWSVLTDYDRLSTHVPNLVESRIVAGGKTGQPGDGSYQCRLYQKGAQRVIGFEFGADVTMEMTESILPVNPGRVKPETTLAPEQRIGFKCVDSFFFSEFDGDWRAREVLGDDGEINTILSYTVDVRPRGPVPVAALEWRIREDVPTNLRAVKRAALGIEDDQPLQARMQTLTETVRNYVGKARSQMKVKVDWLEDETMAAYLKN